MIRKLDVLWRQSEKKNIYSYNAIISSIIYEKENLKLNKIEFYGTFVYPKYIDNEYHIGLGNIFGTKLPALIPDWPVINNFDQAPELIISRGEIENLSEKAINNLALEVKIRFKVSKTIYDKDEYIEYEKSIKNLKMELKFKRLEPKKKKKFSIQHLQYFREIRQKKYAPLDLSNNYKHKR